MASAGGALQAVQEGGGSVVTGPDVVTGRDETPWGRMAVIQDPFGATLGLFGRP